MDATDRARPESGSVLTRSATAARLALLLVAAVTFAGGRQPAIAQSPTPPTGVIVGRVVDADAGTPVSGVVVIALGTTDPGPGARPPAMVTDAQGRFAFRNLAKGSYTLLANLGGNGFSPGGFIVTGMGHQIGAYLMADSGSAVRMVPSAQSSSVTGSAFPTR
jgi:Carboxypeptidase regulatory-like domain